jgi:hypothetical protein
MAVTTMRNSPLAEIDPSEESICSQKLEEDKHLSPMTPESDIEKADHDPRITNFEVSFTGDSDPRSAKSLPAWRKWMIVYIVSGTSLCVACTSSLYVATYEQIKKEFDISNIVATLGLTLMVAGLGLGPMFLAPLSEVRFPLIRHSTRRRHSRF